MTSGTYPRKLEMFLDKYEYPEQLAWRIPGTAEPGGLLSMGSHRVGHDWSDVAAKQLRTYTCTHTHTHTIQFNLGLPLQIMYAHKAYNKMTSPLHNKSRLSKQMNSLPHAKGEKEKDHRPHGFEIPQIQMSLWLKVGGGWPLPSEWPLTIFCSKSELDLSWIQCNVSSFPQQSKTKHLLLLHDFGY